MGDRSPGGGIGPRDPEARRAALLDAALVEFARHGLAGARTSAIAARAGVNKQLISHHFGGKEGLYRALIDRWLEAESEIGGDLDPGFVLLALQAIAAAPVVFPDDVRHVTGLEPDSPELVAWHAEQLRRLVERLA